jgi:hypothetical protein
MIRERRSKSFFLEKKQTHIAPIAAEEGSKQFFFRKKRTKKLLVLGSVLAFFPA